MGITNYPEDVCTYKSTQTLSVAAKFFVAKGETSDESKMEPQSPREIIGSTSRFRVTIINEDREAVTSKWEVGEMRALKNRISDARHFTNMLKWNNLASASSDGAGGSSPAYTTRFSMGTGLKGKTPVEVYKENPTGFEDLLTKQKKFIEGNIGKNDGKFDSANKQQIAAIDDALKLKAEGKLDKAAAQSISCPPLDIWTSDPKPDMRHTDEKSGLTPTYLTNVTVYPLNNYPVTVKLTNFDAPVNTRDNGTLNVLMSKKANEKINEISLTFDAFENLLQNMEDYVEEFKMLHAKECFEDAEKCIKKNKEANEVVTVTSVAEMQKNTDGSYSLKAANSDSGEKIVILFNDAAVKKITKSTFDKLIAKTKTENGANFRFKGLKQVKAGVIYYWFKEFAKTA